MQDFVNGGGEWIRTTEVVDNRFTVCPLWPLGNSPINYAVLYKACPAFLSGRTAQFGAGERTRTPDLLITNSVEGRNLAPLRRFWAFLLHQSAVFDPEFPTVSTRFFRRVGQGVGLAAGRRNKRFFNGATLLVKICAAKQRKVLHPMKRFSYRYKSMASFFLCHSVEVTLSMPYTRWGVKYKSRRGKIKDLVSFL